MSGLPKPDPILTENFTRFFDSVKSKKAKISEKIKTCPREVDLAVKLAKMDLELSKIEEGQIFYSHEMKKIGDEVSGMNLPFE